MWIRGIPILVLVALPMAVPEHIEKRQDLNQLLQLASIAGITLPTDPAILLQLGPLAQKLASALPTPSVLSVLQTAAPKSFISNVVHDQSYANSFQSAFAAGSSPSWFNALPTDVKAYMHTYSGFAGLNSAAGLLGENTGVITTVPQTASSAKSNAASRTSVSSSSSATSTSAHSSTSSESTSSTPTNAPSTSASAAGGSSTSSTPSPTPNQAARPSGAIAVGVVGVVGVLGLAVGL